MVIKKAPRFLGLFSRFYIIMRTTRGTSVIMGVHFGSADSKKARRILQKYKNEYGIYL